MGAVYAKPTTSNTRFLSFPTDTRTYIDPHYLPRVHHQFQTETSNSLITVGKVIGTGEFGEVYQGKLLKKGNTTHIFTGFEYYFDFLNS